MVGPARSARACADAVLIPCAQAHLGDALTIASRAQCARACPPPGDGGEVNALVPAVNYI